ncbi:MAG TPA: DUF4838 domain-containing protein [Verrucomicrobiae bacterium]|nr:DUF4838 domain-containing protein [Verrucomicrobiae bacterium]
MMRMAGFWVSVCGLILGARTGIAADVAVVSGGVAHCSIILPAAASPSQVYAAEELRRFTREMTGAELAIARDDVPLPASAILLGETRHTAAVLGADPGVAGLGDDGFRIVTRPPHVLVVAGPVRGTLYGAYELLERFGGCRWYAKHHSVIPRRADWVIPATDVMQRPAFAMREPFWWGMFDGDFAARCRVNGNSPRLEERHGGKIRFGDGFFVHTFNRLVPPEEFFGAHPEYFSEIGGRRTAERAQLCLTNPDVLRIVTERLLAVIRKNPGARLFSVSQNDWHGACECASCAAIDEREGSKSGTMISFVNKVAESVEKEFPDVWIETLAYQYTRKPPKTVRPRANVVPRLCSIECDFSKPIDASPYVENRKFVEEIRGWAAITDKLYVWDYVTNFGNYLGPHPNFGALGANVRFFRANHVVGLFEQGAYQAPHAEFAELRAWLLAKLLWDPEADVGALYDDFFKGYYGPAAGPVREYFDALQKVGASEDCVLRIGSPPDVPWYPKDFFDGAMGLWDEAERLAAGDARFRYNVRMGAMPVMYARLMRWPKMDVRHVWRDGAFRPEGVEPAYAALAGDLLARMKEGGVTHVAESAERTAQLVALWRGRSEGFVPVEVRSGDWVARVVPEMGARVVGFCGGGGREVISAEGGGVDAVEGLAKVFDLGEAPYTKVGGGQGEVRLSRGRRGTVEMGREISVKGGRLGIAATFVNRKAEIGAVRPVLRAAFPIGGAVSIRAPAEGGPWRTCAVPADQTFASMSVPVEGLAGREILVFGGDRGRAARVRLPEMGLERLWILADARGAFARLFVLCAPTNLVAGARMAVPMVFGAAAEVEGLPEVAAAGAHRADRVVVEDIQFQLGRPGEWGATVPDAGADDGYAVKLFGTHHEWCLQWRVDAGLFEPGVKYRVRMRVRVEKSGVDGMAFWAGVYDEVRRKGVAQIQPKVSAVSDGYGWYEFGDWAPEAGQYLWAGPGVIPKDGRGSAVKAVFIDRAEFVRVGNEHSKAGSER